MNIHFIATELSPYTPSTGDGDAVASLLKSLRLLGHEVTITLPRLACFEHSGLMLARRLTELRLTDGREAQLYETALPSGAKLVLLDLPGTNWELLSDCQAPEQSLAAYRSFSGACRALLESRLGQNDAPELVHVFGVGAGLALPELKLGCPALPRVLSLSEEESFAWAEGLDLAAAGLAPEYCSEQAFLAGGQVHWVKGVMSCADLTVFPSPAYLREFSEPERSGALARTLASAPTAGVLQGVDYGIYNPATDSSLAQRFDAHATELKLKNRQETERELGLIPDLERPLVLVPMKGVPAAAKELLLLALPGLVRQGLKLVVVSEDPKDTELFQRVSETLRGFFALVNGADAKLRQLLAAADFYLELRRVLPRGAELMQAQRYAVIPMAPARDAALDIVVDLDPELRTGSGFLYDVLTHKNLLTLAARAVVAFQRPEFSRLRRRVAGLDWAWDRPARRHLQLYRQLLSS